LLEILHDNIQHILSMAGDLDLCIKLIRKLTVMVSLLILTQVVLASNVPNIPQLAPPQVAARSHILIDCYSDAVLSEENSSEIVEPASLTKIMTMYVVDHEVKKGALKLDDKVIVSQKAWRATGSRMFLEENSEVSVEELMKGIIIQSGNDASVAIAEHVAGSEESFAQLMNFYAKQLGMNNTNFVNATGLPAENHYTTAKDLAILAKHIIRDFPETYDVYSQREFTYHGITQQNRNRLLSRNSHVDGIKTGQTDRAGYCLAASGKVDGMRLIAIVMGTASDSVRTNEANKLLSWGFRFFETKKVYEKHQPLKQIKVWLGKSSSLAIGLEDDLFLTVPQGKYNKLSSSLQVSEAIRAPIKAGEVVGMFTIKDEANNVVLERKLIALDNVDKGNIWKRFRDSISLSASSLMKKMES
jgi:D-alanyl-D-alanine carboxypeptidase (penicillin-binding protein 5/6)